MFSLQSFSGLRHEDHAKWWFSVLDVVGVLKEDDYTKTRNYWKYLKAKLKKEHNQLVSATTQLISLISIFRLCPPSSPPTNSSKPTCGWGL
jgi:hypothetical protein